MCCAVELRHCSELREVALENNRLATPVLDLRCLSHLRALQLFGNPLEFLPELSPCTALRYLSLANVRSSYSAKHFKWRELGLRHANIGQCSCCVRAPCLRSCSTTVPVWTP